MKGKSKLVKIPSLNTLYSSRDKPLEKFYVQDFLRSQLQNDDELRQSLLYQEKELLQIKGRQKTQSINSQGINNNNPLQDQYSNTTTEVKDKAFQVLQEPSRSIVNSQGVRVRTLGTTKDELVQDLYQKIFAQTANAKSSSTGSDRVHVTNINIGTLNNNQIMLGGQKSARITTQYMSKRNLMQSRGQSTGNLKMLLQSNTKDKLIQRQSTTQSSPKRKKSHKQQIVQQSNGLLVTQHQELNEIFQRNKDAKLASFLIKLHEAQIKNDLKVTSRDISYRQESVGNAKYADKILPQQKMQVSEQVKDFMGQEFIGKYGSDKQENENLQGNVQDKVQLKPLRATSPLRFRSVDIKENYDKELNLLNIDNHILNLDNLLFSNQKSSYPTSSKITVEDQDQLSLNKRVSSMPQISIKQSSGSEQQQSQSLNQSKEEMIKQSKRNLKHGPQSKFLPTDIKHMEHIVQYSQPNMLTKYGNVLCLREQCLENFHSSQCMQKQIMMTGKQKDLYYEEASKEEFDTDDTHQGAFEEECENFMRNLHKYYDKYINNENAFMKKSYLESNMFSHKRRTIENLIKHKQGQEVKGQAPEQDVNQDDQDKDFKTGMINQLMSSEIEKEKLAAMKELENPHAELFGSYDYHYYNSKVPPPPKEPLGQPSGRKQVQLLNEWFESVMEQYVYSQKDFLLREDQRKKAFYYSKVILTICIRDLVRQVSVHCVERGAFMEKVLNIYLSIYEAELRVHLHDIDLQKEKHIEQIKNIRDETRSQIVSFEKFIDNLNVKIKELTLQRDKYKNDLDSMSENFAKFQQEAAAFNINSMKSNRSFKDKQALLNRLGARSNYNNEMTPYQGTPKTLNKKKQSIIEQSKDSSDSSPIGIGYLAMKKTRIANQAQESSIQRQKVFKKSQNQKIRIADSSGSLWTDEEGVGTTKMAKERKLSASIDASQQFDNSSDDDSTKKKKKFISQLMSSSPKKSSVTGQLSKRNSIIAPFDQVRRQTIKQDSDLRTIEHQYSNAQRSPMILNEGVQLMETDQRMISEAIDLFFETKNQPLEQQDERNLSANEDDDNHDEDGKYEEIQEGDDQKVLDQNLDYIEHEQKMKLIAQISEITEQLYQKQGQNESNSLSQKQLIQSIVEQVLKNNQETIQKLLKRIHDEDMQAIQKLIGNIDQDQERALQTLNLKDLSKPGSLTRTNFIKALQRRGDKTSLFVRKIVREQAKETTDQGSTREAEMQTEDFHFIDYDALTVETAEIYMFDRISRKLRKIIVEIDPFTNSKVYKQFEFNYKGQQDDFLVHLKSSIAKKQEAEFRYKVEIKNKHYEINRANRTLKSLTERITELEVEINKLTSQKDQLNSDHNESFGQEGHHAYKDSVPFQSGYFQGFELGRNSGYFKGYQEGRHFGHQLGFQDGVKEGWNFGFDDGYKNGVRRVFKECREAGINIEGLDMMDFINKEDQFHGLKKFAFDKLFKVISKNEKLQQVYKLHERFNMFNERKKKLYAKMGRKNVIKMIAQLYQQMIQSWQNQQNPNYLGILEFMYDEFSKKYGNVKLAEKKILQILGSTYYHLDSHPKIAFFGTCLHLTKYGFSNDVLFFYLQCMDKIQTSNVGIIIKQDDKTDIDIVAYLRALEGIKVIFEDKVPIEAYGRIKQEVEKFTITKDRAKVVDFDKLMDHIISNYLRYAALLAPTLDQVYHAITVTSLSQPLQLYENFFMSYGELMMLTEIIEVDKLRIDTDNYRYVEVEKKEFVSILERKKLELGTTYSFDFFSGDINVSLNQFREFFGSSNVLQSKIIQSCIDEARKIHNIQTCKEKMRELIVKIQVQIDELFRGKRWKYLRFLEPKEYWISKLTRIERCVSFINGQIIMLTGCLIHETLKHYLNLKHELYGDTKDDDEEIDLLEINQPQTSLGDQTDTPQMTGSSQTLKVSTMKKHQTHHKQSSQHHAQTIRVFNESTDVREMDGEGSQDEGSGHDEDVDDMLESHQTLRKSIEKMSKAGTKGQMTLKLSQQQTMNVGNPAEKLSSQTLRKGPILQATQTIGVSQFGKKKNSVKQFNPQQKQ